MKPVSNAGQYSYEVSEFSRSTYQGLDSGFIDDPFITTTVRPRGWRSALAVLLGRYEIQVRVNGTTEACRVVFGGDYTPAPPGPPVVMGIDGKGEEA